MGSVVQHMIAWVMSAAVFLGSIHCACPTLVAAPAASADERSSSSHACCNSGDRSSDRPTDQHQHQPGCSHCDAAKVSSQASASCCTVLQQNFELLVYFPSAPGAPHENAAAPRQVFTAFNLPPPLTSQTLLHQHCALNS